MKQQQESRLSKGRHIRWGPIRHRETGRGLGKNRAMVRTETDLKRRDTCLLADPAQEQLQVRTTNHQVKSRRGTHMIRMIAKTHLSERCPRGINAKPQPNCHVSVLHLVATFALSPTHRLAMLIRTRGHPSVLTQTHHRYQQRKSFRNFVV